MSKANGDVVLAVTVRTDILRKLLELADPETDHVPKEEFGPRYNRWLGRKEIRDKLLDILTSTGYGSTSEEA